eukprot:CAMPEP_0178544762 /NCGR_PEP_ID=MMETSP0697-20121206/3287_1 /TAXON_ID=265572 /ORGANISM="Extubocellulus spinifer, Strain CCMP396" /LENGTH=351 /DNA_ID=CAMNT_0020177295 /DNA_START=86 /DNA_END=1141 /DNA_ORIENTATION=+
MSNNEPETAGNENPTPSPSPPEEAIATAPVATAATTGVTATADTIKGSTSTAEERLNALVLSTPRASGIGTGGVGGGGGGTTASSNLLLLSGGSRNNNNSSTTPLSSARASRNQNVVGDGSFEEMMKERARIRKEKDENSLTHLRTELTTMDRALSTEIKRRIELSRSVQHACTSRIDQMENRLGGIIDNRTDLIEKRLVALEEKVEDLNVRLQQEVDTIPRDIERRGKELGDLLSKLQDDIALERRDRLGREGRLVKQVDDHRKFIEELMAEEKDAREKSCAEIKNEIAAIGSTKAREGETFEQMIQREMQELRLTMAREVQERRMEDDEIVAALNRYTEHLQDTLANSV